MVAEGSDDVAAIGLNIDPLHRRAIVAVRVRQQIEKFNRRLILQQAGDRRAGAELISGVDNQRTPRGCALECLELSRQRGGAAGRPLGHRGALQVTVKVVEAEQLQMHCPPWGRLRARPAHAPGRWRPGVRRLGRYQLGAGGKRRRLRVGDDTGTQHGSQRAQYQGTQ